MAMQILIIIAVKMKKEMSWTSKRVRTMIIWPPQTLTITSTIIVTTTIIPTATIIPTTTTTTTTTIAIMAIIITTIIINSNSFLGKSSNWLNQFIKKIILWTYSILELK